MRRGIREGQGRAYLFLQGMSHPVHRERDEGGPLRRRTGRIGGGLTGGSSRAVVPITPAISRRVHQGMNGGLAWVWRVVVGAGGRGRGRREIYAVWSGISGDWDRLLEDLQGYVRKEWAATRRDDKRVGGRTRYSGEKEEKEESPRARNGERAHQELSR